MGRGGEGEEVLSGGWEGRSAQILRRGGGGESAGEGGGRPGGACVVVYSRPAG